MSISRLLSIASIALVPVLPMTASAEESRADQFITEMDGNTLSGTGASGLAFNVIFLSGGQVTYADFAGPKVDGTWHLDRDGHVCIAWQRPVDAMDGCFRMSFNGDKVIWRSAKASSRALPRDNVADTDLKPRQ